MGLFKKAEKSPEVKMLSALSPKGLEKQINEWTKKGYHLQTTSEYGTFNATMVKNH